MENLSERFFQRILLINFGGIGDEILFFPVIEALRYQYPNARIAVVVEPRCRNLMEHNYLIDQVYSFDIKHNKAPGDLLELMTTLRAEAPELIISSGSSSLVAPLLFLSGAPYRVGYDSGKLRFLLTHRAPLNNNQYAAEMYYDLLRPMGFPSRAVVPRMPLPSVVKNWAERWLRRQQLPREAYVLIHPGVSLMSKEKKLIKSWPRERWAELIERLLAAGRHVVLAGGPDDAEEISDLQQRIQHPRMVSAYGETRDLYQLGALMQTAAVSVCVDSAPMHLGVALDARLVAIFGPTDENKLVPAGQTDRIQVVQHPVSCRPCLWATRQTTCDTLDCLNGIRTEAVYEAIQQLAPLHKPSPPAPLGSAC
ncbi:MAG: glycosyltransferase family 9 protein [Candidatus Sericytochromatia bacterium]|nr:glycosyltransferase family 9 protein [Candidatus Sericytochromatia bacterium]